MGRPEVRRWKADMPLRPRLQATDDDLIRKFHALKTDADVADLLEVPTAQLRFILFEGKSRYPYRQFVIPKKNGTDRVIDAPHDTIRILQRKLLRVLRLVARPHGASYGFVVDRSIVTNATPHIHKAQILNLDLENFFPSINFGRVQHLFTSIPFGVGYSAATVLAQLCCKDGSLPQGAPTSPIVANMICYRLDGELKKLAIDKKWFYTRYADDITFSTWSNALPMQLATRGADGSVTAGDEVRRIIESNWFKINEAKVRLQTRQERQVVTGLSVNQFPNVERSFIRTTRAMIANYRLHGAVWSQKKLSEKRGPSQRPVPAVETVIRGRLAFISMVRGSDDPTYIKLQCLANEVISEIRRPTGPGMSHGKEYQRSDVTTWMHECEQSIVQLNVTTGSGDRDIGTGWIIAPGVIATAAHCLLENGDSGPTPMDGTAILSDGTTIDLDRKNYRIHPQYESTRGIDAAVVFTDHPTIMRARVLPLAHNLPSVGDLIGALGFPSILSEQPTLTVTTGFVQSLPVDGPGTKWISVSSDLHGGMSGGPVVTRAGAVAGLVVGSRASMPHVGQGKGASNADPSLAFRRVLPVAHLRELLAEA